MAEATGQPAQQPAQTPASGSGGKKSKSTLIIVIVVILVVLMVGGALLSRYLSRKAGEWGAEKVLEGTTGAKWDVNSSGDGAKVSTKDGSFATGSKATWPSDMPAGVPEFKYGKVTAASKANNNWSVTFEQVDSDAQAKYKADLTAAGWTLDQDINMGFLITTTGSKGNLQISVSFDPQQKGVQLQVNYKQ